MTRPYRLQGELLIPAVLMHCTTPAEVERMLQDAGLLPPEAQERRWSLDAARTGYVLTFTVALTLTP